MDQQMNDIPEYRKVGNAPSHNSERESYSKGYTEGFQKGFQEGNMNALKHSLQQMDVIIDTLTKTIESVEKLNVGTSPNDGSSASRHGNCS